MRNNLGKLADELGLRLVMTSMRCSAKCGGNPFTQVWFVAST